jgi:hypothetical protein
MYIVGSAHERRHNSLENNTQQNDTLNYSVLFNENQHSDVRLNYTEQNHTQHGNT